MKRRIMTIGLCLILLFTMCLSTAGAAGYVSTGSTVTFGSYLGATIEWIVLTKSGDYALLLSKYVLDAHPWHSATYGATWSNSSISNWLSSDFYYEAFSDTERSAIYISFAGPVFLLSESECREYVRSYDMKATATYTAVRRGAHVENNGYSWWWLRDVGSSSNKALGVSSQAAINSFNMNRESGGVRPAVWVNMNAL